MLPMTGILYVLLATAATPSAYQIPGQSVISDGSTLSIPCTRRSWNLCSTIRSELHGYPKPRKLHKRPFWADMFDEEVEIEPLGPPCPKLLEDVVRGERRLRLTLKRSHRQMCCTIVDDVARHVHCFLSTNFQYLANIFGNEKTKHPHIMRNKGGNVRAAYELGKLIGRQARSKGISKVIFDRAGYRYHGRVEALAIGARKVGLEF